MHSFDAMCLTPVHELSHTEIKRVRLRERVSQAVFALYLNTTLSTVKKWEAGEKHPGRIFLKLLDVVARKGLSVIA